MAQVDAKAVSTTKEKDPLHTKYFCKVTNQQAANLVMQISATEVSMVRRQPLRYVLVIDVSGSMDSMVGNEMTTLLDRVKIFAQLVIQNIANDDSMAIVTFSNDVQINFPMTKMSGKAKDKAKAIVSSLYTRGGTNLEIGLMTGLEAVKRSKNQESRDSIILFTDGAANEGEIDSEILVQKYLTAQKDLEKTSCVPVSAFTIGQYPPILLLQMAERLGSEAFYWLNEDEDFEADLLIPVFLRETTRVTDVTITMKTLRDVKFDTDQVSMEHNLESSEEELKYFMHSIPVDITKHIPINLILPLNKLEELKGERILDITITYLDMAMKKREICDFVLLSTKTLAETKSKKDHAPDSKTELMEQISAFMMNRNELDVSWKSAQESLVVTAQTDYRRIFLVGLNQAENFLLQQNVAHAAKSFKEAVLEINKIKEFHETMLGKQNPYVKTIGKSAKDFTTKLDFGEKIVGFGNIGRIFAMHSSIATEMPTAKGVFDPKAPQPYIPPKVETKLKEFTKIVRKTKKNAMNFETTRVFKAQNFLVSESLRGKKIGQKKETMSELIIRCGGTPVPNVNTVFNDTFLVCSDADFKKNTVLVRDSKRAKIPIVNEKFIYDCINQKRVVDLDPYLIKP